MLFSFHFTAARTCAENEMFCSQTIAQDQSRIVERAGLMRAAHIPIPIPTPTSISPKILLKMTDL